MAFVRNLKPSGLSWAHYKQQTIIFNTWNRAIALPVSSVVLTGNDTVKSFADLPGPVNLPVVGTSWSFLVGKKGESLGKRILSVQRDHVNKYGNILKQSLAGHTMVEIADPADVTKVLRSEANLIHNDSSFLFLIIIARKGKRFLACSLQMAPSGTNFAVF